MICVYARIAIIEPRKERTTKTCTSTISTWH